MAITTEHEDTRPQRLGRNELIGLLGMATAAGALGIDAMLPAFADMRRDLGLAPDSTAIGAVITSYFVGLAVGQLFWGPLADRFGRRPMLWTSLGLYAAAAVASSVAPTLGLVLVTRTLWGLAAAGPRIVAMTIIRDSYDGDRVSQALSSLMAVFILVPIVAPSLGAAIVAVASWRWLFAFCALFALVILAWSTRLTETLRPEHRLELSAGRMLTAARAVTGDRRSVGYLLAVTSIMGAFVAYLSGFESVIDQTYDRVSAFPVIFGGLAAVMGAMMLTNRFLVGRFGAVAVARGAFVGLLVAAAGASALVAATGGRPRLSALLVALGALLACHAVLMPNLTSLALEPMGAMAGVASSIIGAAQTAGGALLGGLLMATFDGTARPLVFGFAVFAVIGAACMWWADAAGTPAPDRAAG